MDIEKSRKFYQERYDRAIEQYGENSLTAKICKKKLELLDARAKRRDTTEDTSDKQRHTRNKAGTKPDMETD